MENILNDVEKTEIHRFLENITMLEAVKKVLLAGIYFNGTLRPGEKADPTKNFALSLVFNRDVTDEFIGQNLRACAEGIRLVEFGFKELEKYKVDSKPPTDKKNPAR